MVKDAIKLETLRGEACHGLSMWAPNPVTRGRQREIRYAEEKMTWIRKQMFGVMQPYAQKCWGSHQKLEEARINPSLAPLERACLPGVCISSFSSYERINSCCVTATKCVVICYSRLRKLVQECTEEQSLWLSTRAVESGFPSSILTNPSLAVHLLLGV